MFYFDTCQALHYETVGYKGAFRQDIVARKVFFIHSDSVVEQLLYDFNLQTGDSIKTYQGNGVINTVDSILIGNNYRKRWVIANLYEPFIIEGIGSSSGPIDPFLLMPDGPSWELDCFSQNGITYYPGAGTACSIILGINNVIAENQFIRLFPDPFHSTSLLNVSEAFEKSELKIYNSLGMQVKKMLINSKSVSLNREGISDGIYFYQARNNAGAVLTGKFIVN